MATERRLDLGFAVPMFVAPGVATLRVPSAETLDWQSVRRAVMAAEDLGYDSAWFSDHLFLGRDGAFLESWSTLVYFAGCTDRIRLVTNHYNNNFRHAPLTAKAAATVDVITDGRLELFLSAGYREVENQSYGYDWEARPDLRVLKLDEATQILRALWVGGPVDFGGRFYRLNGAICAPTPAAGSVPIWLGGPLDHQTCELIARRADGWNALPMPLEQYADQAARIDKACRAVGRDPATLRRSLETQVLVLDDRTAASQLDDWFNHWAELKARARISGTEPGLNVTRDELEDRLRDQFVVGTRSEIASKFAAYADLGVNEIACWFMDFPDLRSMTAIATDVRPGFSGTSPRLPTRPKPIGAPGHQIGTDSSPVAGVREANSAIRVQTGALDNG